MNDDAIRDECIPITMTSGTPCVLNSLSFPSDLDDKNSELIYDGDSKWIHKTSHLSGDVRFTGLLLAEKMSIVRGDIESVTLGNLVILREQCVIRPPLRALLNRSVAESIPVIVGSKTLIGRQVVCEAQSVGNYVLIEDNSVIGEFVEIPDGVWLNYGSVVPSGMILAPYCVYSGKPAQHVANLNVELHQILMMERLREVFATLLNSSKNTTTTTTTTTTASLLS